MKGLRPFHTFLGFVDSLAFYGRKLIEEAAFSRSSDRQSRSCGLLMKGPKPFHTFLGFVDSLTAARPFLRPLYFYCIVLDFDDFMR